MPIRDLLVVSIVFAAAAIALKRPWIGAILWTWISIMNPHRYTWGYAYDMPIAAIAAGSTLIGLILTWEWESPFKAPAVWVLLCFMIWITLSWLMGLDPAGDYEQWDKVIKIDFMILVTLALLFSKKHILAFVWITGGSLALLGIKGGLFAIVSGGEYRVWGPPGSFIEDNNEFALALVMAIPLLRFLQMQLSHKSLRLGMTAVMLLCAASAISSYSRSGFLAATVMALIFWWRSKQKFSIGIVIALGSIMILAMMPEEWYARIESIQNYEADRSVLGRFSAWWTAWGIAMHYPFGVGFEIARPELVAAYSPYPSFVHAAHSIYFLVLGNHGFIGLGIFLLLWILTWRTAGWLRKNAAAIPEAKWAADLGAMVQVSLVGYFVGGAFLSLSYFDLPYNIMAMVVLARRWVESRAWEQETASQPHDAIKNAASTPAGIRRA